MTTVQSTTKLKSRRRKTAPLDSGAGIELVGADIGQEI
jgi:hypothetical protein